jgi:hypothetical protein
MTYLIPRRPSRDHPLSPFLDMRSDNIYGFIGSNITVLHATAEVSCEDLPFRPAGPEAQVHLIGHNQTS